MTRESKPTNKIQRALKTARILDRKKKQKESVKRGRLASGPDVEKSVPRTQDNTRIIDDTVVAGADAEVVADEAVDEFSSYFAGEVVPKLLITTCNDPSKLTLHCAAELHAIFPTTSEIHGRKGYPLKDVLRVAGERGFTAVLCITEQYRKPWGLVLSYVGTGPTLYFRMSSFMSANELDKPGTRTHHPPELFLKNFTTRLGRRLARCVHALFPLQPNFLGRSIATFHNQRDFIFFRFYRYIFDSTEKVKMQELGPRFTLRLLGLQLGEFDPGHGKFEWAYHAKTMGIVRNKFHL